MLLFCCVATGAGFAACSGETVENPSNSSGGGGAGSTTSSTTTTTTTSTTVTTTTTSTGAGDTCEQACAYAAECGVPACDFIALDCANPQQECAAQCLLDASCSQIASLIGQDMDQELVGCLTACQSSGEGGAGGGGPSGQDCLICSGRNSCLPDCGSDADCQNWLGCARGCFQNDATPACFAACDAQNPGAAAFYADAYTCSCASCTDECAAIVDPCSRGGGAGGAGGSRP